MKHFEIDHYANTKLSTLSISGQRRVLSAAALVKDPSALCILDIINFLPQLNSNSHDDKSINGQSLI